MSYPPTGPDDVFVGDNEMTASSLAIPEAWQSVSDDRAAIPGCTRKRDVAGTNVYTIDGDDYLSTGGVLRLSPWGRIEHVPPQALEYGRMRGSYVDEACRLLDANDLDYAALSPKLQPYVDAWADWMARRSPKILATEDLVMARDLCVFGYRDRVVKLRDEGQVVLDIKTSAVLSDRERLQIASYASNATDGCLLLQLTKAGKAVEHWVTDWPAYRARFATLARESHAWVQQQEAR